MFEVVINIFAVYNTIVEGKSSTSSWYGRTVHIHVLYYIMNLFGTNYRPKILIVIDGLDSQSNC